MSIQAAVTGAAEPWGRGHGAWPRPSGAITNKAAASSQPRVRVWGGGAAAARCCRACAAAAPGTGMSGPGGPGPAGAKLDINRAGVAELEGALSGIGRRRARGIVRKREVRGGRGTAGTTPCAETRARDPEAGEAVAVSVPGWGLRGGCGGDRAVSVPIAKAGGAGPGSPSPAPSRRGRRVQPPPVLLSLLPGPGRRNRGNAGSGGTGRAPHPDRLRTPSPAMVGQDPAVTGDMAGSSGSGTAGPGGGVCGSCQRRGRPRQGWECLACLGLKKEVEGWMSKCCGHICWEHREAEGQKPVIQRKGYLEQGLSQGGAAIATLCGEQRRKTNPAGSEGPVGPFPGPWAGFVVRRVLPRDNPAPPGSSHGRRSGSPCRVMGGTDPRSGPSSAGPEVPRDTGCLACVCVCVCPIVPLPWSCSVTPHAGTAHLGSTVLLPSWQFWIAAPLSQHCDSSLRGHSGRGLSGSRRDSVLGRADFPLRRS